jgi:hypothetical protein
MYSALVAAVVDGHGQSLASLDQFIPRIDLELDAHIATQIKALCVYETRVISMLFEYGRRIVGRS